MQRVGSYTDAVCEVPLALSQSNVAACIWDREPALLPALLTCPRYAVHAADNLPSVIVTPTAALALGPAPPTPLSSPAARILNLYTFTSDHKTQGLDLACWGLLTARPLPALPPFMAWFPEEHAVRLSYRGAVAVDPPSLLLLQRGHLALLEELYRHRSIEVRQWPAASDHKWP